MLSEYALLTMVLVSTERTYLCCSPRHSKIASIDDRAVATLGFAASVGLHRIGFKLSVTSNTSDNPSQGQLAHLKARDGSYGVAHRTSQRHDAGNTRPVLQHQHITSFCAQSGRSGRELKGCKRTALARPTLASSYLTTSASQLTAGTTEHDLQRRVIGIAVNHLHVSVVVDRVAHSLSLRGWVGLLPFPVRQICSISSSTAGWSKTRSLPMRFGKRIEMCSTGDVIRMSYSLSWTRIALT